MARDQYYGVSELGKARIHRWDDAQALFKAGRWRGAMYVAGYAIECLLKSKLMRIFGCHQLRELEEELHRRGLLATSATIFTHELGGLMRLTQRLDQLHRDRDRYRMFNSVNRWIPAWRYSKQLVKPERRPGFFGIGPTYQAMDRE